MARKAFGAASDYYRLRLLRVDDSDAPIMEWRDDILWRRPPAQRIGENELWRVEAVAIDDDDDVTALGVFTTAEDGHEALAGAEADLAELSVSEFEERYFPAH